MMIYLDNSATSFPKPQTVSAACSGALRAYANPGRGGHSLSIGASEERYSARKAVSEFFNADGAERVIFTLNCTSAVNTVIKGILKSGDHVVVSELEHNCIMRPLERLKNAGISSTAVKIYPCDDEKTIASFRAAINQRTRMIICTQASNVWGIRLPVERLSALAHEYGIMILVDAAQSAGVIPIDMRKSGIDFLCTAGHKGLYGPMGTGILIIGCDTIPESLIEGGTGSSSMSYEQPDVLPDRFESGTPNVSGIAGLHAGIDFVRRSGTEKLSAHEFRLIKRLYKELSGMKKIKLYLPEPEPEFFVPILSFNIDGMDSETAAGELSKRGIAVRAGLHCAPAAHRAMGTLDSGAVRISPSVFNRQNDIDRLVYVLKRF